MCPLAPQTLNVANGNGGDLRHSESRPRIQGETGGAWAVVREREGWRLYICDDGQLSANVTLDQEVAWRLFTKGVARDEAMRGAFVEGDRALAAIVFDTVSIIV